LSNITGKQDVEYSKRDKEYRKRHVEYRERGMQRKRGRIQREREEKRWEYITETTTQRIELQAAAECCSEVQCVAAHI